MKLTEMGSVVSTKETLMKLIVQASGGLTSEILTKLTVQDSEGSTREILTKLTDRDSVVLQNVPKRTLMKLIGRVLVVFPGHTEVAEVS